VSVAQTEVLAFPKTGGETQYLEDVSLRRVVLEYYDQEHLALRRYLSFLGVDVETGQEIVQESFLKLHEHLLVGGDRTNLRAWLYRVAHNLARNMQTAFRTARTDYLPDMTVNGDIAGSEISAEERLLENERTSRFQAALAQLSRPQRECLTLRTQGLKYREIAEILQLSVSTVGENVTRGLERLKELV
jgi:RNA polymerase sigma-70 factor, ECF subfamily